MKGRGMNQVFIPVRTESTQDGGVDFMVVIYEDMGRIAWRVEIHISREKETIFHVTLPFDKKAEVIEFASHLPVVSVIPPCLCWGGNISRELIFLAFSELSKKFKVPTTWYRL